MIASFVDDLLTLLEPYDLDSIWSSEPRIYGLSALGRAELVRAMEAQRINTLVVMGAVTQVREYEATAYLDLGSSDDAKLAVTVALEITNLHSQHSPPISSMDLVNFVLKWFELLDAAAGFVSDRPRDALGLTPVEQSSGRHKLVTFEAIRRYIRGVFWGNALGADLCARLGGVDAVLRQAPAAQALRLGTGVWIQASEQSPAPGDLLKKLETYLAPLLDWSRDDPSIQWMPAATFGVMELERPVETERSQHNSVEASGEPSVVVEVLPDAELHTGLNLHFSTPPSPEQQRKTAAEIYSWYQAGRRGAFESPDEETMLGLSVFHEISGPTVDGSVMRWYVDFGTADLERALVALAHRLGRPGAAEIRRVVLGTECVG